MKSFELLKELLIVREQGAYEVLDKSISLAIDVYCNEANLSRNKFIDELKRKYNIAWDGYWKDTTTFKRRQLTYKMLIKELEA